MSKVKIGENIYYNYSIFILCDPDGNVILDRRPDKKTIGIKTLVEEIKKQDNFKISKNIKKLYFYEYDGMNHYPSVEIPPLQKNIFYIMNNYEESIKKYFPDRPDILYVPSDVGIYNEDTGEISTDYLLDPLSYKLLGENIPMKPEPYNDD